MAIGWLFGKRRARASLRGALKLFELSLKNGPKSLVHRTREPRIQIQSFAFELNGLLWLPILEAGFSGRVENCRRAANRHGPQCQFESALRIAKRQVVGSQIQPRQVIKCAGVARNL